MLRVLPLLSFLSTLLFFLILTPSLVSSLRIPSLNHCDPKNLPDPRTLRPDQITVLINGYSESRLPLLTSVVAAYSASTYVSIVLVLWGNPATSSKTLNSLSRNLSSIGTPIVVIRQLSDSLNVRFFPRHQINTRSVLVCDDDVSIDSKSVEFAFKIWSVNPDRLIGFFARSHDYDISDKKWIYTVHPDKYSIVLTKFMIFKTQYLYEYSCENEAKMYKAREIVDKSNNCEDILMNFVIANKSNVGPILVGANRARDWGDPRNEGGVGVREVGLSSRRKCHRKRRGDCIREFHRIFGYMPLKYSYGKVVNSVGEQGLCEKGGDLVYCDKQIL